MRLSDVLQALQGRDKESAVQCMVLKMLTDFTLMYNACVGVILKRDAEGLGLKGGSPPVTPSVKSGKSVSWTAKSVLFRYHTCCMPCCRPDGSNKAHCRGPKHLHLCHHWQSMHW